MNNKTERTPGPWVVKESHQTLWIGRQHEEYPELLSEIVLHINLNNRKNIANATLVAAAPELLDLLTDLHDAVPKETRDQDWWSDELRQVMTKADALLSKLYPQPQQIEVPVHE